MPYQRTLSQEEREFSEQPLRGPFGGIQSELPADAIETLGFADCVNMILRKGTATVRPGYKALTNPSGGANPVLGIYDFFDVNGLRHQVVFYSNGLFQWQAGPNVLAPIPGALTGGPTDYFESTVVNNKLCFSQGVDKIQIWDGITPGFVLASGAAPAAKFLIELDTHLLCMNTIEGGTKFTQRVRWSGAGDPTDYASFSSGVTDLLNVLGPITGAFERIYGYGYALHNFGLTKIIPTGVGATPFQFVPYSAGGKGCICQRSPASYGEQLGFYVGSGDIYLFNGTDSIPIGARPLDEKRRVGARRFIMAELANTTNLDYVVGYVTSTINGNDFNAYWLIIPGGSTWCYNIDEENWSRNVYDRQPTVVGRFSNPTGIEIAQLIGMISQQSWSPDTLSGPITLDQVLLGFSDGTPGLIDYTNYSETPWSITSGEIVAGDRRHGKFYNRFRIVYQDLGQVQFNVTLTNEKNESEIHTLIVGKATNRTQQVIVPFKKSCMSLVWTVSGGANAKASFIEFTPIYDTAGEYKDMVNGQSMN